MRYVLYNISTLVDGGDERPRQACTDVEQGPPLARAEFGHLQEELQLPRLLKYH